MNAVQKKKILECSYNLNKIHHKSIKL